MDTEISRAAKEKDEVLRKLRNTETVRFRLSHSYFHILMPLQRMEDARDHLLQLKENNLRLESELKSMFTVLLYRSSGLIDKCRV